MKPKSLLRDPLPHLHIDSVRPPHLFLRLRHLLCTARAKSYRGQRHLYLAVR